MSEEKLTPEEYVEQALTWTKHVVDSIVSSKRVRIIPDGRYTVSIFDSASHRILRMLMPRLEEGKDFNLAITVRKQGENVVEEVVELFGKKIGSDSFKKLVTVKIPLHEKDKAAKDGVTVYTKGKPTTDTYSAFVLSDPGQFSSRIFDVLEKAKDHADNAAMTKRE